MQPTTPSLYIHFPWCLSKCPYCDFNSEVIKNAAENHFLAAIFNDLDQELKTISSRNISTAYVGGGTPSLLSSTALEQLLNSLRKRLNFDVEFEISLESNPGSLSLEKLQAYRSLGINRLSIGVQSFQDTKLKSLGRIHNSKQAQQSIKLAQQASFSNINLDLIYGLPEQSSSDALQDLQTAIDLQPTHISWYQLTIEANTPFANRNLNLPTEKIIQQIEQHGRELLANNGFVQYEISAFAKPNYQCQHNLNYWNFGDYLGLGPGAHSKLSNSEIIRTIKQPDIDKYLSGDFIAEQHVCTQQDLIAEFMLNALRLYQPISFELFCATTGLEITAIETTLNRASELGLLQINQNSFYTTDKGKQYLNELLALFIN